MRALLTRAWLGTVLLTFARVLPVRGGEVVEEALYGNERILWVTFRSRVLARLKRVCVVLSDSVREANGCRPVLYLLHGRGRHERSLVDDPVCRKVLLAGRLTVILPDGDDGWYIDSPQRPADRYEQYLEEVVAFVEARYDLARDPRRRGLSGWSMGGYGCTRFAVRHPGRFTVLAPVLGLLDFPREGLPEGQSYPVPSERFGDDPKAWPAWNPCETVAALVDMRVLLITGTRAFDRTMNRTFRDRLQAVGGMPVYEELPGGHTFALVRAALPRVLAFAERHLGE